MKYLLEKDYRDDLEFAKSSQSTVAVLKLLMSESWDTVHRCVVCVNAGDVDYPQRCFDEGTRGRMLATRSNKVRKNLQH